MLFLILISIFSPFKIKAEGLSFAENAKSAIMIEASTGEVLFEKNSDEKLVPASMTKMMSMLLIMEETFCAIKKGKTSIGKIDDILFQQIYLLKLPYQHLKYQ